MLVVESTLLWGSSGWICVEQITSRAFPINSVPVELEVYMETKYEPCTHNKRLASPEYLESVSIESSLLSIMDSVIFFNLENYF